LAKHITGVVSSQEKLKGYFHLLEC
jgi:hypothetical protein